MFSNDKHPACSGPSLFLLWSNRALKIRPGGLSCYLVSPTANEGRMAGRTKLALVGSATAAGGGGWGFARVPGVLEILVTPGFV